MITNKSKGADVKSTPFFILNQTVSTVMRAISEDVKTPLFVAKIKKINKLFTLQFTKQCVFDKIIAKIV